MVGLNVVRNSAVLSGPLVVLMLALCVSPSFSAARIYINGVTPSSAYPGDEVRVYGGGAAPKGVVIAALSGLANETFIVEEGVSPLTLMRSSNLTLGSTFAGDSGDWEISFLTPYAFPGDYDVYVLDNESLTSDVVSFLVLINATIGPIGILNMTGITVWTSNTTSSLPPGLLLFYVSGAAAPSFGPPGTLVTMLGRAASGGEISVHFDDSHVATVVGQLGNWSSSFQVPDASVGNHTIRVIDVDGRWMSSASFYVTSSAVIGLYMLPLSLLAFFAVAVLSATTLFMLCAISYRRRKKQKRLWLGQ